MFLLGHGCWSYVLSKLTARGLRIDFPVWLALLGGILPDFDLFVPVPGFHHTWTHSLILLVPIGLFLTLRYQRIGFALAVGVFSHLLTDGLVGTIPILYPLSTVAPGLNLGIPSFADTALETGALAVSIIIGFWNKDYLQFLRPYARSLMLAIPGLSIIVLSLLFASDAGIQLSTFAFSRRALTLISIAHMILGAILALGLVQGVRAIAAGEKLRAIPARPEESPVKASAP